MPYRTSYDSSQFFVKYAYKPSENIGRCVDSEVVYHGTFFPVLARILHTGRLHASDRALNLGMETHVDVPAVYTASTIDHACRYAWPSSALQDNLYYRVLFQCETSSRAVITRCRGGEVLIAEGHVVIRNVFLFYNCAIGQGQPKCADHDLLQQLELLPSPRGTSLAFEPLRPSARHS